MKSFLFEHESGSRSPVTHSPSTLRHDAQPIMILNPATLLASRTLRSLFVDKRSVFEFKLRESDCLHLFQMWYFKSKTAVYFILDHPENQRMPK